MRFPYVVLLSACALIVGLPLLAQSPNGVLNGLVRRSFQPAPSSAPKLWQ